MQSNAKQSDAEQCRAMKSKAMPRKAMQSKAVQSNAKQCNAKQSKVKQSKITLLRTIPTMFGILELELSQEEGEEEHLGPLGLSCHRRGRRKRRKEEGRGRLR